MGNEQSNGTEVAKTEKTETEKIPETHENGSANGVAVTIAPDGLEVDVNCDAMVEKNGAPPSLSLETQSTETTCEIIETVPESVPDAPVIPETPQPVVQPEEVKKTKEEKASRFGKLFKKKAPPPAEANAEEKVEKSGEDQADASPPAADPATESGLGGDRASNVIVAAFRKAAAHARFRKAGKVSKSTQTENSAKADVSTQTGDNESGEAEAEAPMKTSPSDRDLRIEFADRIPEDAADNQTAAAISEEKFLEDSVFEDIVLRAEQAHVSDRSGMNKTLDGTEARRESKLRESITESDFHDLYSGLPKVVADCVRAVFSTVVEFPHFAPVAPSELHGKEVHTRKWSEGAEDLLIEIEPESPEVGEVFCVPLQVYLPVMENIEKAFWEESDCQEELVDDVFLPDTAEPAVPDVVDPNRDEVAAAGARTRLPPLATVGEVSTELIAIEGLPEGVMTTLGLEMVQEAQQAGSTVQNHAVEALQAAMEALSRELSAIVSLETEEVECDEATKEEETIGAPIQPLPGRPDANLFISEVPHVFVFDEEMFILPLDLKEKEKITNEELPRNDMGSHDVETTAEFMSRTDVNTEAAGLKTVEETELGHAIVKSNSEEKTEAPPLDLCSTSTSDWEADTATQLEEQQNVPVFESVSECQEANYNLTQAQDSENRSRILNLPMSSSGNSVEETQSKKC